jgi:hypothetical protein
LAATNTQVFLDHNDIDYSGFAADAKAAAKAVRNKVKEFLKPNEIVDMDKKLADWKVAHRPAR